ncbi:MAG: hypothetical protein ACLP9L_42025 [Thermoguttaceae bacterium]
MDRITVSNAVRSELDAVFGPVVLVDTAGVPIGQFVPHFAKLERDDCPWNLSENPETTLERSGPVPVLRIDSRSESELEQAEAERSGRPLGEIWKSFRVG